MATATANAQDQPVTTVIMTCALVVQAIIRVAPAVGLKNSAWEQYPFTSG